jgi:hypothetical protein
MQLFFSLQMQAKRREIEAALHAFDSTIKWHCSKKNPARPRTSVRKKTLTGKASSDALS